MWNFGPGSATSTSSSSKVINKNIIANDIDVVETTTHSR